MILLLRVLMLLGLSAGVLVAVWTVQEPPAVPPDRIRAITLDAREAPGPEVLPRLKALGVTHLTFVAFGFQPGLDVPEIRHRPDARWYSESDAGIRALTAEAHALGMGVILKPHLWVGRGAWRGEIAFPDEAAWQAWEADYRAFILHYARLAAEIDAALLVVGTELAQAARQREAFWRRLIAEVRQVYPGPLTYAANWYDEYEHIRFWDALDYVGVQAYFPLSAEPEPTRQTLHDGWQPHRKALATIHRQTGKPILFTEMGYRSVSYAAAEPWRWLSRDEVGSVEPDYALQARLYQAFFEAIWPEPWLAGVIVWKWYPGVSDRPTSRVPLDFTPQGKPAEQVLARGFGGRARGDG